MGRNVAPTSQGGDLALRLRRLSDGARAAKQLYTDECVGRDAVIYEAYEAGWGIRLLERETGLSDSQVQRIVDRETATRQQELTERVRL